MGSIPGSGRSPGEGNGKPLQYSCLENSMDSGIRDSGLQSIGLQESDTTECVFAHAYTHAHTHMSYTVMTPILKMKKLGLNEIILLF